MNTLITTSGFTMIPPSGLSIVSKSLQLAATASGTVRVSGSLGTMNNLFYDAGEMISFEKHFLQTEEVTLTPVGTLVFNYIYAGEPEAYLYGKAAQVYSEASGVQRWANSTVLSGSYQTGFGG